ncbi:hypothetical protein GCM10007320_43670 [Pseudorhodoferax aquiterrae]|uniref:DUF4148 domain-containing protein n=1 Tax=Pseudorhodoferax aquiterrae TaxID=747304 RepID=A0ABQ3G6V3_9BURK|nr:DUF4148 domain-containing protein [Pseudorhodoferax aquiterrae]GHC93019.1 hypothetical protein GCM10007320_43670 [Pseudorhodoferax aquiterrae]
MSFNRIALLTLTGVMAIAAQAQAAQQGPLTREQVRAEYFAARSEGRLLPNGENGNIDQTAGMKSTVTRAQVLGELARSGPAPTGEVADSDIQRKALSLRTRAAVHAEAVEVVRSGVRRDGEVGPQ